MEYCKQSPFLAFAAMDTLKGAPLIATFFGYLAICAALVHWHDKTWKIAIEPTKASVYRPIHPLAFGWGCQPYKSIAGPARTTAAFSAANSFVASALPPAAQMSRNSHTSSMSRS